MIVPELVQPAKYEGKKCLILDLDETLVHSTFTPSANADFVVPVDIDGQTHNVYVMKRPGVSEFLRKVSPHFEIVVYTASLDKYADPLLDLLDPDNLVTHRLFRENCVFHHGHFVKDLDLMNRPLSQTIIVDNSESAYVFHPANAIDCLSFIDDPNDEEMWDIAEFLISHKDVEDVRSVCCCWRQWVMGNTARMRPPSITSII
jgi:RNA polymerase II subunit A small phosphatase-like protein